MGLLVLMALASRGCRPGRGPAHALDGAGCGPARAVFLGACVDVRPAPEECAHGRARDLDDSSCVPSREVRAMARAGGLDLEEDEGVACERGDALVASRSLGRVGCVAARPTVAACPAGSVRDAAACVPVTVDGALDLSRWARAAASAVCDALGRSPSVAAVVPNEQAFIVELSVRVPGNDVSDAHVAARTDAPIPESEIDRATRELDDALRYFGGPLPQPMSSPPPAAAARRAGPAPDARREIKKSQNDFDRFERPDQC